MHPHINRSLPQLIRFAESLGWHDLTPNYKDADGLDVVWYTSGENEGDESDLFLQINEHPIGNTSEFVGSVYAIRYGIWTGWHSFPFPDSDQTMEVAFSKTEPWLDRKWFVDDQLRAQFTREHPECTGYDWQRIARTSQP